VCPSAASSIISGKGLVGTGKVCDLSVKGWRIDGDKPVTVGMKLTSARLFA
jgi:hypothetical protein